MTATKTAGVGGQAFFMAGASGCAQVLVALMYILAARDSEPEILGLAVSAIALGTAAVGFIDFGTNSLWVREIAAGRVASTAIGRRIAGKIGVTVALSAVWAAASALIAPEAKLWISAPIVLALLLSQTTQVPLRAATRGRTVAILILLDRVVASVLFLALEGLGVAGADALWVALTAGSLTSAVLCWAVTPVAIRPRLRGQPWANPWRGASSFGIAGLATSAQAMDVTLLTTVAGPHAAGVYGAVGRWTQPMMLLASAFSAAAAPFVASSGELAESWRRLRKALWMPALSVLGAVVVGLSAPLLVDLLLGERYKGSAVVLQILAAVAVLSILSQPMAMALQFLGHARIVAIAMSTAVALQLVLIFILGRELGAVGAAVSSLCAQVTVFIILITSARRQLRKARPDSSA